MALHVVMLFVCVTFAKFEFIHMQNFIVKHVARVVS